MGPIVYLHKCTGPEKFGPRPHAETGLDGARPARSRAPGWPQNSETLKVKLKKTSAGLARIPPACTSLDLPSKGDRHWPSSACAGSREACPKSVPLDK